MLSGAYRSNWIQSTIESLVQIACYDYFAKSHVQHRSQGSGKGGTLSTGSVKTIPRLLPLPTIRHSVMVVTLPDWQSLMAMSAMYRKRPAW